MGTLFPQASVPGGVGRFVAVAVDVSRGGLWPVGALQVVLRRLDVGVVVCATSTMVRWK